MNVSNFDRASFLSARGDSIINFDIKIRERSIRWLKSLNCQGNWQDPSSAIRSTDFQQQHYSFIQAIYISLLPLLDIRLGRTNLSSQLNESDNWPPNILILERSINRSNFPPPWIVKSSKIFERYSIIVQKLFDPALRVLACSASLNAAAETIGRN